MIRISAKFHWIVRHSEKLLHTNITCSNTKHKYFITVQSSTQYLIYQIVDYLLLFSKIYMKRNTAEIFPINTTKTSAKLAIFSSSMIFSRYEYFTNYGNFSLKFTLFNNSSKCEKMLKFSILEYHLLSSSEGALYNYDFRRAKIRRQKLLLSSRSDFLRFFPLFSMSTQNIFKLTMRQNERRSRE